MAGARRYFRLLAAFARFGLANELSFRANFLVKLFVEVLWLGILLALYQIFFEHTQTIRTWTKPQFFFFVGCNYALGGIIETFFLGSCMEFTEMVRTGDLDFYLLKPIDEQFLITCRSIDWSTAPNIVQGAIIMGISLALMDWPFDLGTVLAFAGLFCCGVGMAYSFLLILTSTAVWFVRNQNLMEMWWLFTTLMRYPREIYQVQGWADAFGWFFSTIFPVILVVNVPAHTMVKAFDGRSVAWMLGSTVVLLVVSRWFFRRALRSYRSASS